MASGHHGDRAARARATTSSWPSSREAKEELFNLRFQAATGQLENHGRLRAVRKDIARIYTVMRERELGITTEPDEVRHERERREATR